MAECTTTSRVPYAVGSKVFLLAGICSISNVFPSWVIGETRRHCELVAEILSQRGLEDALCDWYHVIAFEMCHNQIQQSGRLSSLPPPRLPPLNSVAQSDCASSESCPSTSGMQCKTLS